MSSEQRVVFPLKNSLYASVKIGANYILPLLIYPYLLNILGSEVFGELMLSQAVVLYFIIAVEYGFNLTGARSISLVRNDRSKCARLLVEITSVKLAVAMLCMVLVLLVSSINVVDIDIAKLVVIGFVAVIGAAIQPIWFFQGLERFAIVGFVQVVARVSLLMPVLFFVKEPSDVYLAQFFVMSPWLVSGFCLIMVARRDYNESPLFCRFKEIKIHMKAGFNVFISQVATSLFTNTNTVIVGIGMGAVYAGYFALADKIIRAVAQLSVPVCEALYPRISGAIRVNPKQALQLAKKVFFFGGAAYGLVGVSIILGAEMLVSIINAENEVAEAVKIMAFIPFLVFMNNIAGTQVLLALGQAKKFRNAVIFSGITVLILCMGMTSLFGFLGAPVAILIGEVMIFVLMLRFSFLAAGRNWLA